MRLLIQMCQSYLMKFFLDDNTHFKKIRDRKISRARQIALNGNQPNWACYSWGSNSQPDDLVPLLKYLSFTKCENQFLKNRYA